MQLKILYVMPYNYTFRIRYRFSTSEVGVMAQDLQNTSLNQFQKVKTVILVFAGMKCSSFTINAAKELILKVQANAKEIESLEKILKLIADNQKSIQNVLQISIKELISLKIME